MPSKDDTFQKSAELGDILGNIVLQPLRAFTDANNQLVQGGNYTGAGDIRSYIKNGLFVNYNGIDKPAVVIAMNNLRVGQAMNVLWRQMKV